MVACSGHLTLSDWSQLFLTGETCIPVLLGTGLTLTLLVLPSLWHLGHSQQFGISSLMIPSAFPIWGHKQTNMHWGHWGFSSTSVSNDSVWSQSLSTVQFYFLGFNFTTQNGGKVVDDLNSSLPTAASNKSRNQEIIFTGRRFNLKHLQQDIHTRSLHRQVWMFVCIKNISSV